MKSFNAVYKYGHLYDRTTGKRLLLKDNVDLTVVIHSEKDDLFTVDPKNNPDDTGNKPRSRENLWELLMNESYDEVHKIMGCGDYLYFTIRAGEKNADQRYAYNCCFRVQLLEDLYLVFKTPKDEMGEFFIKNYHSCSCVVDHLMSGELEEKLVEPIYGSSLSDAYTLTYEMYFSRFGRSGVNIYKYLTFQPGELGEPFMQMRKRTILTQNNS